MGVVSGAALLVDYVLTITISIASGADAIFSFLDPSLRHYKIEFAFAGLALLTLINLKTAKRTMVLMATSLAITAGGILLCYLLVGLTPDLSKDKTLNAFLLERVAKGLSWRVSLSSKRTRPGTARCTTRQHS